MGAPSWPKRIPVCSTGVQSVSSAVEPRWLSRALAWGHGDGVRHQPSPPPSRTRRFGANPPSFSVFTSCMHPSANSTAVPTSWYLSHRPSTLHFSPCVPTVAVYDVQRVSRFRRPRACWCVLAGDPCPRPISSSPLDDCVVFEAVCHIVLAGRHFLLSTVVGGFSQGHSGGLPVSSSYLPLTSLC